MKVALLVPGGVDRSGTRGVIPCLLWLIERIARVHELHVFSLLQDPRPCRYPLLGAEVHNIGSRPRRLRALATIVAEHRRRPFDLLHAIWAVHPGVVAAAAGHMLRRPVLLHINGGDLAALHDIRYGALRNRRGRLWLRLAAAGATHLVVQSGAAQANARSLGIVAERVTFGVDLERWPCRPPQRRTPGRPARLLWIGSLNRVKDPETLLLTATRLRDRGLEFRLDVVGEDTLDGAVHRLAAELGLDSHVRFHGFLTHAELRPVVEAADLLLVTSRQESGPLVALEAAVAGVPVVGTPVGHLADWAPDAARTARIGDPEALATAVIDVLRDEELRVRLASCAQRRALAEDADWTAARITQLYGMLAGQSSGLASASLDPDPAIRGPDADLGAASAENT